MTTANLFLIKLAIFVLAAAALVVLVIFLRNRILRDVTDAHHRRAIRRGVNTGLFVVIAIAAAFTFSTRLTGLAVSLGVAGAAVAFALQQVLASAVAWIQITVGNVYRMGDRVKMGGVVGDVIHVNVFLTTLMEIRGDWVNGDQYTGRIVRVPNAAIYQQPVYNYNDDHDYLWDELTVPIKYGSDRELAVKIMTDAVNPLAAEATEKMRGQWEQLKESYAVENAQIEPQVFLVANDNWLEYSVRYPVHYHQRRSTKSALCEAIVSEIEKNADRVSIASGTYDIVGLPQIKVALADGHAQKA